MTILFLCAFCIVESNNATLTIQNAQSRIIKIRAMLYKYKQLINNDLSKKNLMKFLETILCGGACYEELAAIDRDPAVKKVHLD